MCEYCDRHLELVDQHAALVAELMALEGGSYVQREALAAQVTAIHRQIEANIEAGDGDGAACDVWKESATVS